MKKTIIASFILGGIAAAFCYHAYVVYQLKSQVETQGAVISQVVQFINSQISKK